MDVIDPVTNKVVLKVEGIEVPHGVVVSPDGTARLHQLRIREHAVGDRYQDRQADRQGAAERPSQQLSVSNDGKYVFVGIAVAPGAVDVIDTASMKLAKTIPVKGAVHNTYVTPDGKYVVAGSVAGKMVTVIDEKTLAVAWELPMDQGVRPMAFEKAADGSTSRIFVQVSNLHGFEVVDFKTHKVTQTHHAAGSAGERQGGIRRAIARDGRFAGRQNAVGEQLDCQRHLRIFAARSEGAGLREDGQGAGLGDLHARRQDRLRGQFRREYGLGRGRRLAQRDRANSGGRSAEAQRNDRGSLIYFLGCFLISEQISSRGPIYQRAPTLR